jgi:hypothetical protein
VNETLPAWGICRLAGYLVCRHDVTGEDIDTVPVVRTFTLRGARRRLEPGLTRFPPGDGDDPHLVETWI